MNPVEWRERARLTYNFKSFPHETHEKHEKTANSFLTEFPTASLRRGEIPRF
jgi:hypothetical protein